MARWEIYIASLSCQLSSWIWNNPQRKVQRSNYGLSFLPGICSTEVSFFLLLSLHHFPAISSPRIQCWREIRKQNVPTLCISWASPSLLWLLLLGSHPSLTGSGIELFQFQFPWPFLVLTNLPSFLLIQIPFPFFSPATPILPKKGRLRLKVKVEVPQSCLDFLRPHGLYSSWNSPGQNTGVGSLSLLQEIFQTQRSNPGLPHYRKTLYQLSHKGSPSWVKSNCTQILNRQDPAHFFPSFPNPVCL